MLGGSGPDSLIEVAIRPEAARTIEKIQLWALVALLLAGVAILLLRRRAERALRRAARSRSSSTRTRWRSRCSRSSSSPACSCGHRSRRSTGSPSSRSGIAPAVFLTGLLSARLARSDVADLFIELDANPASAEPPRRLGEGAARSVAGPRLLAARAGRVGRRGRAHDPGAEPRPDACDDPDRARRRAGRRADPRRLVERRARAARRGRCRGRDRSPERTAPGRAQGADPGAERVTRARDRGRAAREAAPRTEPARRGTAAAGLDLARARADRRERSRTPMSAPGSRKRGRSWLDRWRSCATSPAGSIPRWSPATASRVALESLAARAPVPVELKAELDGEGVQERVEVAAYYVVAECLANVGKHARAKSAEVGGRTRERRPRDRSERRRGRRCGRRGRLRPPRPRRSRRGARRELDVERDPDGGGRP